MKFCFKVLNIFVLSFIHTLWTLDSYAVNFNFPLRFRFFLARQGHQACFGTNYTIYKYIHEGCHIYFALLHIWTPVKAFHNDAMYYMRNIPNIAIGMGMPCSTHQKPSPMGALRIYKGRTLAGNVTNIAPPTAAHAYIFHSWWMHRLYQEARHPMWRRSGSIFWRQG